MMKFKNTFTFSNNDINKFTLLLRKGVYSYEYMDDSDKFNKTFLLDKKGFYSELYLENMTNEDYIDAQKVCEEFELKNLSKYNDLYLRKDVLFLVVVFEIFRKIFFRNL